MMLVSSAKEIFRKKGIAGAYLSLAYRLRFCIETCSFRFYQFGLRQYSYWLNKPLVHVIGDSHTLAFRWHRFVVHHIGAPTAYNLINPKSTTRSAERLFAELDKINVDRDAIVLSFGEIDCRIHIFRQYQKSMGNTTLDEVIQKTIEAYGTVLGLIRQRQIRFWVYGIPPAAQTLGQYASDATPDMRSQISQRFNELLRDHCRYNNYSFIDIYAIVSDEEGFVRREFLADEIHLNRKVASYVWKAVNIEGK